MADHDSASVVAAMELGISTWRAAEIASKAGGDFNQEREEQISLFRDLFGNPFHPVTINPAWFTWNDGTVVKIAQGIYDELAFDRLPILADALEDAGCGNAEILNHCRSDVQHVRGCWVVTLLHKCVCPP